MQISVVWLYGHVERTLTNFGNFFAEMLLSEYAIKWCFVISPSIPIVSALPVETWTQKFGLISHAVYQK